MKESIRKDPDKYGRLIYHNEDINAFSIPPQTTISPIAVATDFYSPGFNANVEQNLFSSFYHMPFTAIMVFVIISGL